MSSFPFLTVHIYIICVCVCVCVCVYVCVCMDNIKVWVSCKMQSRFQLKMYLV